MPSSSGEYKLRCPVCDNPKEKFFISALGKGVKCFHCGHASSWRAFQRRYEPPTPEEQALESFTQRCVDSLWNERPEVVEYLRERGLSEETIRKARLGFCGPENGPKTDDETLGYINTHLMHEYGKLVLHDRITIPYIRDGIVLKVRGRVAPGGGDNFKYLDVDKAEVMSYLPDPADPSKSTLICEGEFDALRAHQEGFQALGIPGANSFRAEWVAGLSELYLALDGDAAGRAGMEKLKKDLPEVRIVDLPEGFDCTDYLNIFGKDSFASLVDNATLFVQGRPQREDRLAKTIEAWADWAYSNDLLLGPRIGWAPRLERAISGWSKGLFLLGSLPNSGKTGFMVKSAYECASENDDAMAVYLSLDDDMEDAVTRLVALKTGISFEAVRSPRWYFDHPTDPNKRDPESLETLNNALRDLGRIPNLVIRDAKYGRSLDYLRNYFSSLRSRHPEKSIVVFIDSLAKVTADQDSPIDVANANAWKGYLASELKYLSTVYGLCIVTPADLRKINEGRRPTNDDLRDSSSLAYEANCVLLAFNEVSSVPAKAMTSVLRWNDDEGEDNPIFEVHLSKNKKAMFRGTLRYRFHLKTCNFQELTKEEDEEMDYLVQQQLEEEKESKRR